MMARMSDYHDDGEPDEMDAMTVGGALAGFAASLIVSAMMLFERRRNPRRARLLSRWAKITIEVVGIVVFMLAAMVISGAQP